MPGFTWMTARRGRWIWAPILGISVFSCLDNTVPEPIIGPDAPVIPGTKLKALAHWDFNDCATGTLKDISGNTLNGKIHGALCANGVKGSSLRFNGSTDYVDMGLDTRLDLDSDMTLSAWISPSDIAGTESWYEIAAKRKLHDASYGLTLKVGGRATPFVQWYFGDGVSYLSATAPLTLADDAWTHIAVTREIEGKRSYMSFYVDGKPVKTAVVFGVPGKFPKSPFTLGRNSDPGANQSSFKGRIDEVSVYGTALDSAAIAGLYKSFQP